MKRQVALVSGGTSGMGLAVAKRLLMNNVKVYITSRNDKVGKKIESDLGENCIFIKCDVSKEYEVEELYRIIAQAGDRLTYLFNNAGIWITELLDDIDEEKISQVFSTDFNSVVYMTKHFIKQSNEHYGVIVNNASMGGLEGYTNGAKQYLYHSAKSAVIKFSKLCAKNYAPKIRVNCICPGIIDTNLFENRDFSRFLNSIPLGYIGTSEDVANLVSFLFSDEARYITGTVITIDGGASLT